MDVHPRTIPSTTGSGFGVSSPGRRLEQGFYGRPLCPCSRTPSPRVFLCASVSLYVYVVRCCITPAWLICSIPLCFTFTDVHARSGCHAGGKNICVHSVRCGPDNSKFTGHNAPVNCAQVMSVTSHMCKCVRTYTDAFVGLYEQVSEDQGKCRLSMEIISTVLFLFSEHKGRLPFAVLRHEEDGLGRAPENPHSASRLSRPRGPSARRGGRGASSRTSAEQVEAGDEGESLHQGRRLPPRERLASPQPAASEGPCYPSPLVDD